MARPINADPQDTRRRVLRAATEQFSAHGSHGTSLRGVAKTAGVSLATIHHYFGNKQALYSACLDASYEAVSGELAPFAAMFENIARGLRDARFSARKLARALEGIVRGGFQLARSQRSLLQLAWRPLLDTGELDARWRELSLLPFLEQTAALLARVLNRRAAELRLDLQALITLGMRYALSTPRELALLSGATEPDCEPSEAEASAAIAAFEDHLVSTARRLLQPGKR